MDSIVIGNFLAELRKANNMTQEQLGDKLGVTNKTISRWETGKYMPPVDILKDLSELYGISINEILCGRRLEEAEYKTSAEGNISTVLLKKDEQIKRQEKIFYIFLALSSIIAMAVMELVFRIEGYWVVKFVVIILTLILAFIANTLNICLLIAQKQ